MIAIALDNGTDSRLMWCGYEYVPLPPPGEKARGGGGRPLWLRMYRKKGVWVGDLTQRRPVAFDSVEVAQSFVDELVATHNESFARSLLLVNATTGAPIEVDA